MAKKNYSKMSTENVKKEDIKESLDPIAEAVEAAEPVEETAVEPKKELEKKVKIGVVCDCVKLNVRNNPHPNAHIELTIDKGTEVEIVGSEGDFYRVRKGTTTEGFNGWCMKKYIKVKQ